MGLREGRGRLHGRRAGVPHRVEGAHSCAYGGPPEKAWFEGERAKKFTPESRRDEGVNFFREWSPSDYTALQGNHVNAYRSRHSALPGSPPIKPSRCPLFPNPVSSPPSPLKPYHVVFPPPLPMRDFLSERRVVQLLERLSGDIIFFLHWRAE